MELLQGPRHPLPPPHQPRSPNSLVAHLSSPPERHNLKRAFAAVVFLVERNSKALSFDTLAPALRPCENRVQKLIFPAIFTWHQPLFQITRKNGGFAAFLRVFEESCRHALDEKIIPMKPDISARDAGAAASVDATSSPPLSSPTCYHSHHHYHYHHYSHNFHRHHHHHCHYHHYLLYYH